MECSIGVASLPVFFPCEVKNIKSTSQPRRKRCLVKYIPKQELLPGWVWIPPERRGVYQSGRTKKRAPTFVGIPIHPPPPHGLDRGGIHPEIGTDHPHPTSGTILPSDRSQSPPPPPPMPAAGQRGALPDEVPLSLGPGGLRRGGAPHPRRRGGHHLLRHGAVTLPGGGVWGSGPQGQTVPGCRSRILSKMRDVGLLSVGVQIDLLNR